MKQADLLQKVAEFKTKFYPRKWARYDEARVGTLKLIPPEYRFPALINDYNAMRTMFFGEVPAFDAVMDGIRQMEDEINTANV